MSKQYIYEVEEQSVDIRKFEIVSDRKLTYDEVQNAICLSDITTEGYAETNDGITATYLWTNYGDNAEIDIEGDLKEDNE